MLTFSVTKGPGVNTTTELASDERRARIALACMTEPGDAVTSGLVGKVCAVETVDLLDSHALLPGPSPVESGPSRLRRYGVDLRRCCRRTPAGATSVVGKL